MHICTAGIKYHSVRHVEKMKELYTGPIPKLPLQLGKLYAYLALVLVFSSALPLLHMLLLVHLILAYTVDKWYLLRVCRKPVPYSSDFIFSTLWWLPYILLLKLLFAVYAFGSLPGVYITDVLDAVSKSVDSSWMNTQSAVSYALSFWYSTREDYWMHFLATTGSVVLVTGLSVMLFLLISGCITDRLCICSFSAVVKSCVGKRYDSKWPSEYPPFSAVLNGGAASQRVRIYKAADATGRGEKLALESDVNSSSCANCIGPVSLLLCAHEITPSCPCVCPCTLRMS